MAIKNMEEALNWLNKRMKDKENRKVEGQLTTGEIIEINGKKYKRQIKSYDIIDTELSVL